MNFPFRCQSGLLVLAALFALAGAAQSQIISTYAVPLSSPNSGPSAMATAPDGTVWFVEQTGNEIGFIDPFRSGVAEVALYLPGSQPNAIAVDKNSGLIYFTEPGTNQIGQYNPATGGLIEFSWGVSGVGLAGCAVDGQGRIWFTENLTNRIGVIDTHALTLEYFSWTTADLGLAGITFDQFGDAWFCENRANRVGFLDPNWNWVYDYFYTTSGSGPWGITVDPDNDVWFAEQNAGAVTLLDQSTYTMFQFPLAGGFSSQPKFVATTQNNQGQTIVASGETGTGQVDLINANSGAQTQVQASSSSAEPTGVTFSPTDNSLWFTDYNSGDVQGYFYDPSLIIRRPTAPGPRLASVEMIPAAGRTPQPLFARRDGADGFHLVLVAKAGKGNHGHMKPTKSEKHGVQKGSMIQVTLNDRGKPSKKQHPIKKKG